LTASLYFCKIVFRPTTHHCIFGILWKISAITALSNLEIHKVFLRFSALFWQKFLPQSTLDERCDAVLIINFMIMKLSPAHKTGARSGFAPCLKGWSP
jgi:hypothetical protein